MAQQPWYKDGLRFECTQCGECCTGAPGFVWVNKQEIESLAGLMTVGDVDEFERKYVRKVGIRKSLVEFPNGDCVFFCTETKRCTVYEARPRQCRTWPFWDSNLRSEEAWEETCQICPGSGKGTLHQLGEVEKRRKVLRI